MTSDERDSASAPAYSAPSVARHERHCSAGAVGVRRAPCDDGDVACIGGVAVADVDAEVAARAAGGLVGKSDAKSGAQHEVSARSSRAVSCHEEHRAASAARAIASVQREVATARPVREGGANGETTAVERGDVLAVHGVFLRRVRSEHRAALQKVQVVHRVAEHGVVLDVQARLQVSVAGHRHAVLEQECAIRRVVCERLVVEAEALAHVLAAVHLHQRLELKRGRRLAVHAEVVDAARRRCDADGLGRIGRAAVPRVQMHARLLRLLAHV